MPLRLVKIVCCFLIGMAVAHAAPPPNANPAYQEWFDSQFDKNGLFCCTVSDGHILDDSDWRTNGKSYEVRINGKWYTLPDGSMVNSNRGGPNPTGHAVVWYTINSKGELIIFCFAQGFEG